MVELDFRTVIPIIVVGLANANITGICKNRFYDLAVSEYPSSHR